MNSLEGATDSKIISQIFENGRTHRYFTDKPVEKNLLHRLYELAKIAPSSSNVCPMRITFVVSEEWKLKVIEAAAEGNKAKIKSAPVVAIVARDTKFYNYIKKLSPHMDTNAYLQQDVSKLEQTAIENSWLQAGFLIAAARSLGLDCGPIGGFSNQQIDNSFYKNSSWRSNFLMNLGYGDSSKLHSRGYRLPFDESCSII